MSKGFDEQEIIEDKRKFQFFEDGVTRNIIIVEEVDAESRNFIKAENATLPMGQRRSVPPKKWLVEVLSGEDEGKQAKIKDYAFDQMIKDNNDAIDIGSTFLAVTPKLWKSDAKWGDKFNFTCVVIDRAQLDEDKAAVAKHDAEVAVDLP